MCLVLFDLVSDFSLVGVCWQCDKLPQRRKSPILQKVNWERQTFYNSVVNYGHLTDQSDQFREAFQSVVSGATLIVVERITQT